MLFENHTTTSTERYTHWIVNAGSKAIQQELESIGSNQQEITERFYRYLEFGTGGMRGVLGAGTNRMNTYTIRRVAAVLIL